MEPVYRCMIVDDEKPAHDLLRSYIAQFEELAYVSSAYDGKEALDILEENRIDIVFLDISMPVMNGMDLADRLSYKPVLIFTTAYEDYAFEAWQKDAAGYLKKPITEENFRHAVQKAITLIKGNTHLLNEEADLDIPVEQVRFISCIGNYVKVHTTNSKQPLIRYRTLGNIMREKPEAGNLVRVHRSYIVNKTFIKTILKQEIQLSDNTRVPVGRKYKIIIDSLA